MREITCGEITAAVEKLCVRAATWLPPEMAILIECAYEAETCPAGADALKDIMDNYVFASESGLPICQDTGMAVVFADIGQDVHITGGLFEDAVNEGVRRGYAMLRKSVVADPLRRVNTEDNTPAVIHTRLTSGDSVRITVAPKGFGSENMSAMRMFLPSDTKEDIVDFIVSVVKRAGANPCPPVVLGVGLGGTVDMAALLAKRALCRPVDKRSEDSFYADMEKECLEKINGLDIGPMGYGGRTTCIAVNIETYPTHIAGLPCVVNMSCHATRHAETVL